MKQLKSDSEVNNLYNYLNNITYSDIAPTYGGSWVDNGAEHGTMVYNELSTPYSLYNWE